MEHPGVLSLHSPSSPRARPPIHPSIIHHTFTQHTLPGPKFLHGQGAEEGQTSHCGLQNLPATSRHIE